MTLGKEDGIMNIIEDEGQVEVHNIAYISTIYDQIQAILSTYLSQIIMI